jgi:hypothetical protein
MKTNLTLEERETVPNKVLCVAQDVPENEEQLWTVYEEGDELPVEGV